MKNLRKSPRLVYAGSWALAGTYNFLRDVPYFEWKFLLFFNVAHFTMWALLGLVAMPLMRRYPLTLTRCSSHGFQDQVKG